MEIFILGHYLVESLQPSTFIYIIQFIHKATLPDRQCYSSGFRDFEN